MAQQLNMLDMYETKDRAFDSEVMDRAITPANEYEYCSLEEELENITDPDWNQLKPDYIQRFPAKSMLRVIGLLREKELQNRESKKQNTKVEKIEYVNNKIEWNKTQCEVTNLNKVIENEKDSENWITVTKKEKTENIKTEMCKSYKKYICKYKNCRFAHSLSELVITDCKYGKECKAVNYIEKSNTYRNDRKKDKVCCKKHPSESNENVHSRLGLVEQQKATEEEMDITESYIENFEQEVAENKTSIAKTINGKIRYLPCDQFIKYELETPLNIVSIFFYGLGHKKVETPKITVIKKKNPVIPINDGKKQLKINEIRSKISKNKNIIDRFAPRVDNIKCQEECTKLRKENEQLEKQILELEKPVPVLTVAEKKAPVIVKKSVPVVTVAEKKAPVIAEKKPFNLEAKSFISALNIVSSEPSQKCCDEVKPKTVLKTELCRSVGNYKCPLGNNCKFAHSIKELTVIKCSYGNRCFDVECVNGTYVNKENMKNRICQRQHPEETLDNVHNRLNVKKENKEKSELCKSFGKYECHHGKTCRYAHSLKELNIIKCTYGNRCFDVDCIGGKYVNRKNIKNRICQRQHEGETIENVHDRLSRKM